ncbi:MAG: CARDB domain-containing protein [Actinomycetota bacterium]|nr:CARDB domain-containing protein [Actinomycetota bacterium]
MRNTSLALEAIFHALPESGALADAQSWLAQAQPENNDYLSRLISALAPLEVDTSQRVQSLLECMNRDGSLGAAEGYEGDVWDTALALSALARVGEPAAEDCVRYLSRHQNDDGSWGATSQDQGDVRITAQALIAVCDFQDNIGGVFGLERVISEGAEWLRDAQNTDGGWGVGSSNLHDTLLAYRALKASSIAPYNADEALSYILQSQDQDGHWDGSALETSLAVLALTGLKPDLSFIEGSIIFSDDEPTEGDMITLTAEVENAGFIPAGDLHVSVFQGDPDNGGDTVGEWYIASDVPPGGSLPVSFDIDTTGSESRGYNKTWYYLVVDSMDEVEETREGNNTSLGGVTIIPRPDLFVSLERISYFPKPTRAGQAFYIRCEVENIGLGIAENVTARFFAGNPLAGGVQIGDDFFIHEMQPGAYTALTLETSLGEGPHDIYVVIDPDAVINERDESNNVACKNIEILPAYNLRAWSSNTHANPLNPYEGEVVELSASIMNDSIEEIADVRVAFFDGDPSSGGEMIGEDSLAILDPWSCGKARVDWDTTGELGTHEIFVVVDPQDEIGEASEEDNVASIDVVVGIRPDLYIEEDGLSLSSDVIDEGSSVDIGARIYSGLGLIRSDFSICFLLDDPYDYSINIGEVRGLSLDPESFIDVSITWDGTLGHAGQRTIYAVVDYSDRIGEGDEENNVAQADLNVNPTYTNLHMVEGSLTFSDDQPEEGDLLFIGCDVGNDSSISASSVVVRAYDGHPLQGGTQFDESSVYISGGDTVHVGFSWYVASGWHDICVLVDPEDSLAEYDEEDNQISGSLFATSTTTDVAISRTDVGLSDCDPVAGEVVEVTASVRNTRERDAELVKVSFYEGDPGDGGSLFSESVIDSLPVGGEETVAASWDSTGKVGAHEIWVVADPDEVINEADEGNNSGHRRLIVHDGSLPTPYDLSATGNGSGGVDLSWSCEGSPYGYLVYRDGVRISGPFDIAPEGTASASSIADSSRSADKAIDGDTELYFWRSDGEDGLPAWLEIAFPQEREIDRVAILWGKFEYGEMSHDYEVQVWDGQDWQTVASAAGSLEPCCVHFFDPVFTSRVRIYVTEELDFAYSPHERSWATIYEVDIYPRSVNATTYTDEDPPQGEHRYGVVSCNLLGDESAVSDEAAIETSRDPDPPASPSGLEVCYSEIKEDDDLLSVDLEWDANEEDDIAGYFIYRNGERIKGYTSYLYPPGSNPWGHFEALCNDQYGFLNLTHDNQTQEYTTITPGILTFRDFLLDSGDYVMVREKETGRIIGTFSGDQGEVVIPMALSPDPGEIWVSWEFLVSSDYKEHGADIGAQLTLEKECFLDYTGGERLRWNDSWLDLSGEYVYEITAVDKYLNESEPSSIVVEPNPPSAPENLGAECSESSIILTWDPNGEEDIAGYNVYRYHSTGWALLNSDPVPHTQSPAFTESIYPTRNFFYRVTAVDNLGIESEPTEVETGAPDLTVSGGDISFYPLLPWTGDELLVNAAVHNLGLKQANDVRVVAYDGDPSLGGIALGEAEIGVIEAEQTATLAIECGSGISPGMHDIFIVLDPDSEVSEIDETNNTANTEVEITSEPRIIVEVFEDRYYVPNMEGYWLPVFYTPLKVTDRFGEALEGMDEAQFEVEENGQESRVINLSEVDRLPDYNYWLYYRRPPGWAYDGSHRTMKVTVYHGDIWGTYQFDFDELDMVYPGLMIENPDIFEGAESSMSMQPDRPQVGETASVIALVKNFGGSEAQGVVVRLLADGEAVQEEVIENIIPGQAVEVEFEWKAPGQDANLTAVVDPDDAVYEGFLEGYDLHHASLDAQVVQPLLHDLAVYSSEIVFSSDPALEGERVEVQVPVHNLGTLSEEDAAVRFYAGDPDAGGEFVADSLVSSVEVGGEAIVSAVVDTLSLPDSGEVFIMADPDSSIAEIDEENNVASADINVVPNMLEVEVATDSDSYSYNDTATIDISVVNQGAGTWDSACKVAVLDQLGNTVTEVVLPDILGLAPGSSVARETSFECEGNAAGSYTAAAELSDIGSGDRAYARSEAGFEIEAHRDVSATVFSGKRYYSCTDSLDLHCQAEGESFNLFSESLDARFYVENSAGTRVFESEGDFTMLYGAGPISIGENWQMNAIPAGSYTAGVEILTPEDLLLAQAQGGFDVLSTLEEGGGLTGTLAVDPSQSEQGDNVEVDFSAGNDGNASFESIDVKVTVAPLNGDIVTEESFTTSLEVGGEFSSSLSLDTGSFPLVMRPEGDYYMVALSARVGGEDIGLDVGSLRVMPALDLIISSPAVSPDPALAGADVVVSAQVYNASESAMTAVELWVRFYIGEPGEDKQIGEDIYVASLAPGEQVTVATTAMLESGDYTIYAAADPLALIGERDEENNLTSLFFHVYEGPDITGTLALDAGSYSSGEDVDISVSATNYGDLAASAVAELYIEDSSGQCLETLQPLSFDGLAPGETEELYAAWNTQETLAGEYRVHLVLRAGSEVVADESVPFVIEPVFLCQCSLSTDKQEYDIFEEAAITAQVTNTSPNYEYGDLVLDTDIYDPEQNQVASFSESSGPLYRGDSYSAIHAWDIDRNIPGTYRVDFSVSHDGQVLCTSSREFLVISTQQSGSGLTGGMEVTPPELTHGETFYADWWVENVGNSAIEEMPLRLEVSDQGTSDVIWSGEAGLYVEKDGTTSGSFEVQTQGFPVEGGEYHVTLTAEADRGGVILAEGEVTLLTSADFEVEKAIPGEAGPRVLVWVDNEANEAVARSALDELGCFYTVVRAEEWCGEGILPDWLNFRCGMEDFVFEMRSGRYNQFWILSVEHPIARQYAEEVREKVIQGAGLVLTDPANLFKWGEGLFGLDGFDVFGVKSLGFVFSQGAEVDFLPTPISDSSHITTCDPIVNRLELTTATEVASGTIDRLLFGEETRPVATLNQYGLGRSVLFAFDFSEVGEEDRSELVAVLRNCAGYLHEEAGHDDSCHAVTVEISVTNQGSSCDVLVEESVPQGASPFFTPGWVQNGETLSTAFSMEAGETATLQYAMVLPEGIGVHEAVTEVFYLDSGGGEVLFGSYPLSFEISDDAPSLKEKTLLALDALSPSWWETWVVCMVESNVEGIDPNQTDTEQLAIDIHKLIKSVELLLGMDTADVSEARSYMDRLLNVLQQRYTGE